MEEEAVPDEQPPLGPSKRNNRTQTELSNGFEMPLNECSSPDLRFIGGRRGGTENRSGGGTLGCKLSRGQNEQDASRRHFPPKECLSRQQMNCQLRACKQRDPLQIRFPASFQ